MNQNIIPYTLHDGLLVEKEHQIKTEEVILEILKKHLGVLPKIKVENFK